MIPRRILVAAIVVLIGLAATAQEPILRFSVAPESLALTPGGSTSVTVRIENDSIREADDVEVAFEGSDALSISPAAPISVIPPFDTARWDLEISAANDAPIGVSKARLEFIYTYCVGDLCFQIVDGRPLEIRIEAPAAPAELDSERPDPSPPETPVSAAPSSNPWRWALPLMAAILLAAVVLIGRAAGGRSAARALIVVGVIGGLAYGVALRQHEQAQGIGAVLCTSCVGIEEARHEAPRLSAAAIDALSRLEEHRELVVFYAPWCHSCPYAEAMVEAFADRSDRITYRLVNVEDEPETAKEFGIIQSGRTIVPATLRIDTGEVIFGIDDLERRLLTLIGGAP